MTAAATDSSYMAALEGRFDWDDFEADLHAGLVRSKNELTERIRQWASEGVVGKGSVGMVREFILSGIFPEARARYDALPQMTPRFTDDEVRDFRRRKAAGETSASALAREHGVPATTMRALLRGKTYKHVAMDETFEKGA